MSPNARAEDSAGPIDFGLEALVESWTGDRIDPEYRLDTPGTVRARREVEDALRASADPIVITGPSGHGKSLLLRWLWRRPPRGFAPIFVPYAEALPGQLAAAILAATRAYPVADAAGALARSLRTQALRGRQPVLLVDDLEAMPPVALSELLSIADATRVEVRLVAAGSKGARLDVLLRVLGREIGWVTLDAPWTRADAERLVARIGALLPIEAADSLAAIDLDEVLRTSRGNPRQMRAAIAAQLRELNLPRLRVEPIAPPPEPAVTSDPAGSEPTANARVAVATLLAPPQPPAESASDRAARLRASRAVVRPRAPRSAARHGFRSPVPLHASRFAAQLPALWYAARSHASRWAARVPAFRSSARSYASRFAARLRALHTAARLHASRFAAEQGLPELCSAARARLPRISARTGFAITGALAGLVAFALLVDRAPAIAPWSAETADADRAELLRSARSWTPRERAPGSFARVDPPAVVVAEARIPVAINSDPWSNIEVDGVDAGSTPLTIELAPGVHRFRAVMADGRVVEKEFEVTADRNRIVFR